MTRPDLTDRIVLGASFAILLMGSLVALFLGSPAG